jgi:hypothetical protein
MMNKQDFITMSDRDKGLAASLQNKLSLGWLRKCLQHIIRNVRDNWRYITYLKLLKMYK